MSDLDRLRHSLCFLFDCGHYSTIPCPCQEVYAKKIVKKRKNSSENGVFKGYEAHPKVVRSRITALQNPLVRHPGVAVLEIDCPAMDEAVLFQHTTHDHVAAVGVNS